MSWIFPAATTCARCKRCSRPRRRSRVRWPRASTISTDACVSTASVSQYRWRPTTAGSARIAGSVACCSSRSSCATTRLNFAILAGEAAGTRGRIDFDADYRHITPFVGLQAARAARRLDVLTPRARRRAAAAAWLGRSHRDGSIRSARRRRRDGHRQALRRSVGDARVRDHIPARAPQRRRRQCAVAGAARAAHSQGCGTRLGLSVRWQR